MKTLYTTYTNFAKRLVMTMMVLLTIGVGIVWADTYTWTFKTGDLSAGYSSVTKGSPEVTWNTTYEWDSDPYFNYDTNLDRGLQIGSEAKHCIEARFSTSAFTSKITNISITAAGKTASIVIKVGNNTIKEASLTTSSNLYSTGEINVTGDVEIIISNTDENAFFIKSISVTYEGAVEPPVQDEPTGEKTATLVTDVDDLSVGDEVIIVSTSNSFALSTTQNNNNRGQASITKKDNNNKVIFGDDTQIFKLQEGTVEGTFAFYISDAGYLYAASSSNNYLRTQTINNDNGSWTITITSAGVATIIAQGSNSHNWLRHNNSNKIFSCYSNGQGDVSIYKYVSCSNKVTLSTDTETNATINSITPSELETCGDDTDRQVTVTISPASCYSVTNDTRLSIEGITAEYVSGPTADGEGNYNYVYRFAKDATGSATISVELSTKSTYTINYKPGTYGEGEEVSDTKICGEDLTLRGALFTRLGYNQTGWATTDGGNKEYDLQGTYSLDADVTLYPVWTPKSLTNYRTLCTYTITYHTNGGDAIANGSYTILSPEYVLPTPTRTGYIFDGWYDNEGLTGTAITTIPQGTTGDKAYWAKWDCALASATVTGTFALVLEEQFQLTATAKDSQGNTLTCPADATYTWQRKDPSTGDWVTVTDADADKTTLTYPSATVEHCGVYRCVIAYGDCQAESNVGTDDDGYKVRFFHLKGTFEGGWTKAYPFVRTAENGIAVCTLTLNAGQYFEFKIYDGISEYGNGGTIDRTITDWEYGSNNFNNTHLNTGADGDYVFTLDYNALLGSGYILTLDVTYPLSKQAEGHTIYYDNLVHNWTNVYYRIGHTGHNQNSQMTLVPGTSHLYKCTTPKYDDFEAWQIANNVAWSGLGHSIYKVNTGDGYAISAATEYKKFVVVEDITLTPDKNGTFVNGENCTYYPAEKQPGMKSWNTKVIPTTGATITVSYTDVNNAKQSFTSGDRDLAHTCLLTITAVADAGYTLGTLTVNDIPFTSGNVDTLSADAIIKVTATPNTYTISFDGNGADAGSTASVSGTYLTDVTLTTNGFTRTDYTFTGWNTKADGSGSTSYADGATFRIAQPTNTTLYAQWKPIEYTNYRTACTGLITWYVDGVVYATTETEYGAPITSLPNNPANNAIGCCADAFVGWTASTAQVIPVESIFSTLAEAQTKYPSVSSDMTFYAVFATAAKGVGTSTVVFSEMGYANGGQVTSVTTGDGEGTGDATIAFVKAAGSSNEAKYYNDGSAVRVYAGGTITVTSTYAGAHISKVVLTYASNDAVGDNTITAAPTGLTDNIWTGNAQSVTFTVGGSTGHRRIAAISVTTDVDGRSYTNYVTHCETMNSPTLGEASLAYANGTAIEVKCGQRSSMNSAAVLSFPEASNLTCPITLTATSGFLLSTSKNDNSKYGQSVTIKPIKSEPNKGKITQKVYVRAEAAASVAGAMSGTITVTGSEIAETTIDVNANVKCTSYTLTLVNHLGNTISTTEYYEGDEVAEIAAPTTDDCSDDYTFDGWSQTSVEYGSLIYNKVSFPFTMPAEDVTLYPVYICSKDYHRVTEELGTNNWEGQYLIAASDLVFANGKTSDLTVANISEGFVVNNIVKATRGDLYSVSLIAVEGGYVLKTQKSSTNTAPYVFITAGGTSTSTNANITTADNHPLSVTYNEPNVVIKNPANTQGDYQLRLSTNNRFTFNLSGSPIYLYKKYLYTTPLICGSIEAADAVVTSTAGQTIKVNVPITLESTLGGTTTITATSDNQHFTVTSLENISAGNHTIAVHYTPDATIDSTEIANITLTASHGNRATTTFQVTGRHLPENFVIAAKWGDNWYALPANMTSESITEGVLIEVDDAAAPTKALAAPNTTKYGLKSVYTSIGSQDRYAVHGERLVFVENVDEATPVTNKTLYNGGGDAQNSNKTSIQVYAQYKTATSGYYETNPNRYEWIPTTTNLKDYILTSAHTFTDENARTVSLDKHGIFGTLLQDKSYSGMVRLLPVDNFYAPVELQVVEWKEDGVNIMYTGNGTKATTQIGNGTASTVLLSDAKIDHAVYTLSTSDLTTATNQALIIAIKDEANNTLGTTTLTIPWIVSSENTMASAFSAVSDATDIVILKGATLTAEATKYTYNNVTIYGGGKLAIPTGTGLGMNTLTMRVGAVENDTYVYAYPELVLNGEYSNTSAQINLDYLTTYERYYSLSVPYPVKTKDIKYPLDIYGSNVKATNTGSFALQYYDGAARATGSTGWKDFDESVSEPTLEANVGYTFWGAPKKVSINGGEMIRQKYGIQRIPMKISAENLMKGENADKSIAITAHPAAKPNDMGWNYLGTPFLAEFGKGLSNDNQDVEIGLLEKEMTDGKWTGGWVRNLNGLRYVTFTEDGHYYWSEQVAYASFQPFNTFFIQAAKDGSLEFSAANRAQNAPARLLAAAQEAEEITTGILLTGNGQTDRTGLLIADNFTEAYDFNADLSKFENSSINLYTIGQDGKLAYMAINQALAEQAIPVGITAPADGEYVIAFDDDRYDASAISALYLIDYERQETTNLLHYDYTFQTAAGTYNQRFALQVAFLPKNTTSVEWAEDSSVQLSVSGNDLLLANLPGDASVAIYDALGRLMTLSPATAPEMRVNLPTGYYLIRIANKQQAVVIDTVIP